MFGFERRAWAVVTERGHIPDDREAIRFVADKALCTVVEVETSLLVPLEELAEEHVASKSDRADLADKLRRLQSRYINPLPRIAVRSDEVILGLDRHGSKWDGASQTWLPRQWLANDAVLTSVLTENGINVSLGTFQGSFLQGGQTRADALLEDFLRRGIRGFAKKGADLNGFLLTPYFAYGFLSPATVWTKVREGDFNLADQDAVFALLIEIDLGINFVHYNFEFEHFAEAVHEWIQDLLVSRPQDPKRAATSKLEIETGGTLDAKWNKLQKELISKGCVASSADVAYWVGQILTFSEEPKRAFKLSLDLLNRFHIFGLEPLGYFEVAKAYGLFYDEGEDEAFLKSLGL